MVTTSAVAGHNFKRFSFMIHSRHTAKPKPLQLVEMLG
jgi:hypothetical protein